MRRLTRSIMELRSYRDCLDPLWPNDLLNIGLLNTAIALILQVESSSKISDFATPNPEINPHVDRTAELIRQINTEIKDADVA